MTPHAKGICLCGARFDEGEGSTSIENTVPLLRYTLLCKWQDCCGGQRNNSGLWTAGDGRFANGVEGGEG